jgi:hypothetical protein
MISCLLHLVNGAPKYRGLKFGEKNTNKRERMEAHCVLYADYFVDVSTYIPKVLILAVI